MTTETDSSHLPQSSYLPPQCVSSNDSLTQGLQNEGVNNNGFQIPSCDDIYSCIVFNINQLKNILLSCFNPQEPDNIAREANDSESSHVYQSTTSLDIRVSLQQTDGGFEALTKNLKQCEIWNNNSEDQTYYTIEGSAYMISRKPFDPIGRPFNPFGPIERPFPRLPSSDELADLGFCKI